MENIPLTSETSEDTSSGKKEKKRKPRLRKDDALSPAVPRLEKPLKDDRVEKLRSIFRKSSPAEVEAKNETKVDKDDPELEKLSPGEEHLATRAYVEQRKQAVASEQVGVEQDSPDAAAAIANELLLEDIEAQLGEEGSESFEELIERASQRTEQALHELFEEANQPEAEIEPEFGIFDLSGEEGEILLQAPIAKKNEEVNEHQSRWTISGQPQKMAREPRMSESTNGDFANSAAGSGYEPARPQQPARPNISRTAKQPESTVFYEGTDTSGVVLTGSVLSYLLGRRRGRLQTEKRIKPVQKKLERQINSLYKQISEKETYIRKIAHEQVRQGDVVKRLRKYNAEKPKSVVIKEAVPTALPEREAERLGHVIVAAEQKPRPQPEPSSVKKIELLAKSADIKVGGTTLKEAYEDKHLSDRALERLVVEHERGKDILPLLKQEVIEKEKDYERDPQLRDSKRPTAERPGSHSGRLDELLQKLEPKNTDSSAAQHVAEARVEASRLERQARRNQQADVALTATIAVLTVIVFILLLTR